MTYEDPATPPGLGKGLQDGGIGTTSGIHRADIGALLQALAHQGRGLRIQAQAFAGVHRFQLRIVAAQGFDECGLAFLLTVKARAAQRHQHLRAATSSATAWVCCTRRTE
jgi:hypothetical protein